MAFKVCRGSALLYTLKPHGVIVLCVSATSSQFFHCSISQICNHCQSWKRKMICHKIFYGSPLQNDLSV